MREIVMDTETTGLDPNSGDRIVEIGAVELFNHMPTGKTYHQYINPQRDMPEGAFAVHGLSAEFLSDKPLFKDIAQEFLDFAGDSKMVIHNAAFDMKFLNAELKWLDRPELPWAQALDTLAIARKKFPGAQNSLDALCRRFGITTERELHGALLDSEILAEVYLELIGGRQPDFALSVVSNDDATDNGINASWSPPKRPTQLPSRITEAELEAHKEFVGKMGEVAVWAKFK
ncbi:DNA polymerase III subunit epsilon [Rhodobacterales bacterium 52_120_T64]|nr:DNA polymerase III subunit epsilon [Rhodobacterales bacterium 52_120_T64]